MNGRKKTKDTGGTEAPLRAGSNRLGLGGLLKTVVR